MVCVAPPRTPHFSLPPEHRPVQRKVSKRNTPRHPGFAALNFPPSGTAPGPAYKGHPWPFTRGRHRYLAASMRLGPLRSACARPPDGGFGARLKVWIFELEITKTYGKGGLFLFSQNKNKSVPFTCPLYWSFTALEGMVSHLYCH